MKNIKINNLILYILFVLYYTSIFAENDSLCGPKCLYQICDYFNVKTTLDEICHLTKFNEKTGTIMLDLFITADKFGLPAVPISIDLDRLYRFKNPSIAYVNNNHFLVVHYCKGNNIYIQDPPGPIYPVTKKAFKKRWNGEVLVFDKKLKKKMAKQIVVATAPTEGPHINFTTTIHDAGTVPEGKKLSHTFVFTNIGTDTLDVTARSTCSCTAALLTDKKVPPGGMGKIKIEYDTLGRKGKTKHGAAIRTNDQDNKLVNLAIAAIVKSSVKVLPDRLWMDEIAMGETIIREILVIDPGDSTLTVGSVTTPEGINAKILPEKQKPYRSIPVQLVINAGNNRGAFEKHITIMTNDPDKPAIQIPISGTVLGEAKVFPPVVFFGQTEPGKKITRQATITSTNCNRLDITNVSANSPYISTELTPVEHGKKYTLTATMLSPEPNTTVRDNLRVYVNGKDSPVLEIPVFARISKKKSIQ